MNKKNKSIGGKMSRLCKLAMMTGAIALSSTAFAQNHMRTWGVTDGFGAPLNQISDVKGFSAAALPGNDGAVLAGTMYTHILDVYDYSRHMPVFLRVDNTSFVDINHDYIYHDDRFFDIRAVDIVTPEGGATNNVGYSFMTAWGRPLSPDFVNAYKAGAPPYNFMSNYYDRDAVKIYKIDNSDGTIAAELQLSETSTITGVYGNSMFPMSTMYDDASNRLYVCGFITPDNTRDANYIDAANSNNYDELYATNEKIAFVLYIDCSTWTLGSYKFFDTYSPTSVPNTYGYDFDMAMRMKLIPNGDLVVTGSVNDQVAGNVRSANMALILDPGTLNIISDQSFVSPHNGDGLGPHEFGVGIEYKEKCCGQTTNKIFIIGNKFPFSSVNTEYPYNYLAQAGQIHISALQELSSTYTLLLNRFETPTGQPIWATGTLPAGNVEHAGADYNFLIEGLADATPSGYTVDAGSWGIGSGNINPFLFDIEVDATVTTAYKPTLSIYENKTGTSNFNTLGGAISNILYLSPFATREDGNSPVIMTAPKFVPGIYDDMNGLGIKIQDVKKESTYSTVGNVYPLDPAPNSTPCQIPDGIHGITVSSLVPTRTNQAITVNNSFTLEADPASNSVLIDAVSFYIGSCMTDYDPGHPDDYNWRPTGVDNITNSNEFKLYPNPATSEVHVSLANSVSKDAKVSIVLMNMYGQTVGTLYSGKASNLNANTTLHLPSVATGIYTVQIIVDGQMSHAEKLVIE